MPSGNGFPAADGGESLRRQPAAWRRSLLLGSGSLLLSRGRLLLGLGYLGRIRRVDGGPYHDGRAASGAKNRMRFGHQVYGQKRDIGHEHHDKGTGYYCNPA